MIEIGENVLLEYIEENELKKAKSKAVSIENNELLIAYPVDVVTGRTVILHNDMEVTVEFVGKDEVPYRFTSRIKGKVKEKLQMICLEVPPSEKMKRIQRRQYVRTDAVLDVQIQPTNKEEFRTLSYNISAGGIAVILADGRSFQSGESLRLIISLPEEENTRQIETEAVVRRIFDDLKSGKCKMTLEFTEIAASNQQFLLQYCIRRQLNKRRKTRME
ncbi:flagellar brake domain-containing protein [Bacillus spizizenii]|uniref:flagellar brake protein n=1 Tax=Bacillus spizizenii TaxID=96241 RepID=UPI0005CAFBB7|nr:flagellar brake domain-containing protein [Bacillus spizizenii]MCY7762296.1 flagellar brake domain-containing protein [Bacillus spizizenii]MCY7804603.1 flagellar brake domain-containing protein [Bacillus spizizenii]MCY7807465.1 flagellar brake domain-containing protein [Bacillus spizizenii]MCY7833064.1 flagellar brake domain-containing protein [Bacillus spizizenii]MCY7871083.1 flagellar brake domain-containing protein [Bacillus spizizenii]